jgi:hypothetical protein
VGEWARSSSRRTVSVQLLVGPFGIVDARPEHPPIRVVEIEVDGNVINVEDEYDA